MRKFLGLLVTAILPVVAAGQIARVNHVDAEQHLFRRCTPLYPPPLAEQAHIQGTVLVEVEIDSNGSAAARRVVGGHPMLTEAAANSVKDCKFKPFVINGKATPVVTVLAIRFGEPSGLNAAMSEQDLEFQDKFWMAVANFRVHMSRQEAAEAQQDLSAASSLLKTHGPTDFERASFLVARADASTESGDATAAEKLYSEALKLNLRSEAIPRCDALSGLAAIYAKSNRTELARDAAQKAARGYEATRKRTKNPDFRRETADRLARPALLLVELAVQRSDSKEIAAQCKTLSELVPELDSHYAERVSAACK